MRNKWIDEWVKATFRELSEADRDAKKQGMLTFFESDSKNATTARQRQGTVCGAFAVSFAHTPHWRGGGAAVLRRAECHTLASSQHQNQDSS